MCKCYKKHYLKTTNLALVGHLFTELHHIAEELPLIDTNNRAVLNFLLTDVSQLLRGHRLPGVPVVGDHLFCLGVAVVTGVLDHQAVVAGNVVPEEVFKCLKYCKVKRTRKLCFI